MGKIHGKGDVAGRRNDLPYEDEREVWLRSMTQKLNDDMLDALKYSTWRLTNNYRERDPSFLSYNLMLGEETMNEKKAQARRLLHRKLQEAEIHVKDHSTMDSISCGSACEEPGYWIPVKLFVSQAELVSDKEYERVAYETASTMDIGTLLDYVTNSLIDIYKDDYKRFEEDKNDSVHRRRDNNEKPHR